MGKAEENKRQKQTKLLNTAFQLFTTKGILQTSVADIANSAGVGKGTFYLYFKDKYDIQARLISHRADQLFTHAFQTLEQLHPVPTGFDEKLIVIIDDVLDQLQDNHTLLKFISKNLSWGVFRHTLDSLSSNEESGCYTLMQELIQSYSKDLLEPDLMLYTIIELVSSTCYSVILHEDPTSMDTYRVYLRRNVRSIINNHRIPIPEIPSANPQAAVAREDTV